MPTIQTVSHTRTESSEIILPGDLNNLGHLFGGRMVSMIDKVAAIAALKGSEGGAADGDIDVMLAFLTASTRGIVR